MFEMVPTVLAHHTFDADRLMAEHPPIWRNRNKALVYRLACPVGCSHSGTIEFTRWQAPSLPERIRLDTPLLVEPRGDVFGYEPNNDPARVEWYLNFANWDLFCSYGGGLFAQDEMQVTEHPALGALREALLATDTKPFTVDLNEPTPILISGVQRRIQVATNPDASAGRPEGLYGNQFTNADSGAVERACTVIEPPTISNILAMEAPTSSGIYTAEDIAFILRTAATGFTAARMRSQEKTAQAITVIHTGYWGCGAYGGNRIVMALLQLIAARMARLDRLVFHTVTPAGIEALQEACGIWEREVETFGTDVASDVLVSTLTGLRFEWGVSDGN
jgi:hypothetical protein